MIFRSGTVKSKLLSLQALLVVSIAVVNALAGYFIFSKYLSFAQREKLEEGTASMVIIASAFVRDCSYQLVNLVINEAVKKYNQSHNPLVLQAHFSTYSSRFPVISFLGNKGVEEVKNVFGDVSFNFTDYSGSSFYREARDIPNKVYVSSLRFEKLIGSYVLDFAYQHTDYFDDDLGFVLASARVLDLKNELKKIRDNDKGFYLILDKNNNIIATNYNKLSARNIEEFPDVDPLLLRSLKNGKKDFIESLQLDGQKCVISTSFLEDLHWKIINIAPHLTYYASLRELRNSNLIIALTVLVVGVMLTYLIAKSITVPISNLEKIISDVSSSQDMSLRAHVESQDELGSLAESFNRMLDRIETSQQEITETKNYLNSIIKHMTDFMIVTDSNGTITVVNQNVLKANDIEEDVLIGKNISELMKNQNGEPIFDDAMLRQILESGFLHQAESEVYNWQNKRQFLSISAAVLKNVYDDAEGIVFIAQDISQRKKAEEKQFKLEQELQQARKLEAIGTLAGGIAHDFNTLIGTIIGYAEMISADLPETSPLQDDLATIIKVSERATTLVRQIREFSKPKDSVKHEIDVVNLVKNNINLVRTLVPSSVVVEEDYQIGEQIIFANEDQLNQILINLCTNAVDVMTDQKGTIRVKLALIDITGDGMADYPGVKPAGYVWISVADDGWGITPEIIERIFDPYFTTKETGKGSGMGLAVVHSIVTSHSGYIFVRSAIHQGTTFDIFLPTSNKELGE